ncbi:MAG TPA: phosphoenolpyruvate-utilizing N-terminal domain-containing protein, partial [Candidatus Acidoferrum sp.]|nr:phosphoenolpyruvate-utilizing N-terminal domain-containing protein [Candidatus Acidoferrum sp.]
MSPRIFRGIGVSPGVAVGKALVVESRRPRVKRELIDPGRVPLEMSRLRQALEVSRRQVLEIQERIAKEVGAQYARIFDAHLLILEDRWLADQANLLIQSQAVNAEFAVQEVLDPVRQALSRIEDGYLRERRTDVDDVGDRLLRNLLGQRGTFHVEDLQGEVIVFAHDLSPSDTAQLHRDAVLGLVTETGGRTSHSAIVARSLEIPAVVGVEQICAQVQNQQTVILDGTDGVVVLSPDVETLTRYQARKQQFEYAGLALHKLGGLPAETQDGYRVRVTANIEFPEELQAVREHGAEGVGLYRTEFLYLNRPGLPNE